MSQASIDFNSVSPAVDDVERSTVAAVSWRVIPFLVLAYFFCVLDRVNVSFAALTMNADLAFSPLVYAWGAGIFFIGYFILEIPSNMLSANPPTFTNELRLAASVHIRNVCSPGGSGALVPMRA